jgi:hypothetical protein
MEKQIMKEDLTKLQKALSRVLKDVERLKEKTEHAGSAKSADNGGGNGSPHGKILSTVHKVIKHSRKGIAVPKIKQKTGLDDRQISNALYKLTKKGAVETKTRGVYVAIGQ